MLISQGHLAYFLDSLLAYCFVNIQVACAVTAHVSCIITIFFVISYEAVHEKGLLWNDELKNDKKDFL